MDVEIARLRVLVASRGILLDGLSVLFGCQKFCLSACQRPSPSLLVTTGAVTNFDFLGFEG
jgi:hypothetical protein